MVCLLDINIYELHDKDGEENVAHIIQEEMVSILLKHLDINKSMGPDVVYPRAQKQLMKVLTKPLSITYQQSWLIEVVPFDWRQM